MKKSSDYFLQLDSICRLMMNNQLFEALIWLKNILEKKSVNYQIVGGTAAYLYGCQRPIYDIDVHIERDDLVLIMPYIHPYVTQRLTKTDDDCLEMEYLHLTYNGHQIEIGLNPGIRIRNPELGIWFDLDLDFTDSKLINYRGIDLSVISLSSLIGYKSLLAREVDFQDVEELESLMER